MSELKCPVSVLIRDIRTTIESGELNVPRSRRIAEEIQELLGDIAWGRASEAHVDAIQDLAEELGGTTDDRSPEVADLVRSAFADHREIFHSHISSRNCATGDCARLAPAPCQMTCPAGIDIPTYLSLIGEGRDAEAIAVIRRDCPFPWVCGLVCTRPCEFMCVRGRIDKPVSIKPLKGFAAERAMSHGEYRNPAPKPPIGKKVAVIGAGPAGLSCAYYLALEGYAVTVFESRSSAGGMLLLGIPRYRLPREVIDRETAMLKTLGVAFEFNTRFGVDATFQTLKEDDFQAFFIAIGAHLPFKLGIPGETTSPHVIEAVDFLRDVALGWRESPGNKVLVIGGGNVAIDAARTALRLGSREVVIVYRRTRSEMPADPEEVEQAEEEGIGFEFLTIPVGVHDGDKALEGLECLKAELIAADDKGRMRPRPIAGSEFMMEADVVISAIGQQVESDCLASLTTLEWSRRQTISVNTITMETSMEGVFAAGDAVTGPATVIEAIGGGKRAARAIHRCLNQLPQPQFPPVPVRRGRIACAEVPANIKMTIDRPEMPLLNLDRRRTTFQQVELGYAESTVRDEAKRCLRCDICLRCGKCVEICRDKMGVNALSMGYFDFDHPVRTDFRSTAELCILCGACAANCPTGAMDVRDVGTERILSLCGTILNRERLVVCEDCGKVIGTDKYMRFIQKRTGAMPKLVSTERFCDACARQKTAAFSGDKAPV
ncbi:MAG: FAD-dependent oxidoreductase [Desulfobacteraceae bacterium]|nr:FAD-dependent oxidoreductase [Desulfobacteraceae bacterium]